MRLFERLRELLEQQGAKALARRVAQHLPPDDKGQTPEKRVESVRSSLNRYVRDERSPGADYVVAIARAANVSADWLLGLSEDRRPEKAPRPLGWDEEVMSEAIRETLLQALSGYGGTRIWEQWAAAAGGRPIDRVILANYRDLMARLPDDLRQSQVDKK